MSSILTNTGAMTALQTLRGINQNLAKTQDEISTGKKIATAQDNGAIWAIAKTMEADVSGFKAVNDSLSIAEATVNVAASSAEQIVDVMRDIRDLTIQAQSENADYGKIQAQITEKVNIATSLRTSAQFNGVNLLNSDIDGAGATALTVVGSVDRAGAGSAATATTFTIATEDFEANVDLSSLTAVADQASAATAFGEIEGFINTAIQGAADLGAQAERISDQKTFVSNMIDTLKQGVGALVDADMEEASARLQALQVQQQLGVQALSIANQAPQTILSLFR